MASTANGGSARRVIHRARSDDMEGRAFWSEPGSPSNASEDFDTEGKYDSQVQSYIPISVPNLLQSLYEDVLRMGGNTAVDISGNEGCLPCLSRVVPNGTPRPRLVSPSPLCLASPSLHHIPRHACPHHRHRHHPLT